MYASFQADGAIEESSVTSLKNVRATQPKPIKMKWVKCGN